MRIALSSVHTPLLASLSRFAASFATSPARGAVEVGFVRRLSKVAQRPTAPLAGEVASLGASAPSRARRGVSPSVEAGATYIQVPIPGRGSFVLRSK